MSFKVHLIIISFIIVAVYLTWQLMPKEQPVVVAAPEAKPPAHTITIAHASLGKNCLGMMEAMNTDSSDSFSGDKAKLIHDDNVLTQIGNLCNGKEQCSVSPTGLLASDPIPECADKLLEVEYRCFSYDRPWAVRGTSALTIDCAKTSK